MKRMMSFLLALMMIGCTALAWEVSDEMIAFAAQVAPGYHLLDGWQYDDTAMLILSDGADNRYFAGCVKEGDAWSVTLSAPLPEKAWPTLNCPSADTAVVNLYSEELFQTRSPQGDWDCNYTIRLQEDGRWLIEEVRTDNGFLYFSEGRVDAEGHTGGALYGEFLFSRDVTGVDWLTFPITMEEAADQMALDDWAVTAHVAQLYDGPMGDPLALYQPGVPLRILEERNGYCRAAVLGGEMEGWFRMVDLFIGRAQLDAPLTVLPYKELTTGGDCHVLGVWLDDRVHVLSDQFPTGEGFLPEEVVPLGGPFDGPVG